MKDINTYIVEKILINKNTKLFDKDKFIDELSTKYKMSSTTLFMGKLIPWFEKYNVVKYEIYGWPGINKLMDTENTYIEDKDMQHKLANELLNKGKKIAEDGDNSIYGTDTLFALIGKSIDFSVIFKKV